MREIITDFFRLFAPGLKTLNNKQIIVGIAITAGFILMAIFAEL